MAYLLSFILKPTFLSNIKLELSSLINSISPEVVYFGPQYYMRKNSLSFHNKDGCILNCMPAPPMQHSYQTFTSFFLFALERLHGK